MASPTLSFDLILDTDYDSFLKFCEQQHCAENLTFWSGKPLSAAPAHKIANPRRTTHSDVEDFKKALESRDEFVDPPPPQPIVSNPIRSTLSRNFRKTMLTPKRSSSFTTGTRSAHYPRNSSMLSVNELASTSPSARSQSTLSNSTFNNTPASPSNFSSLMMEERDFAERLVPMLMSGSSVMKIEMSMTKNLADKLRINRADVAWLELAQAIFLKYFDVNSPTQICVAPEIVEAMEDRLEQGDVTPDFFHEAQTVVYQEMKAGLYPLYLHKMWVNLKNVPPAPVPVVEGINC